LPKLNTLTFQIKLGSMLDKTQRIMQLVGDLSTQLNLDDVTRKMTLRTAQLCKADLATQMVVEMTSLQGIMGRYYALHAGEPDAVANGVFEHYLPRYAGDATPKSQPGLVVGLADRLDTLVGLFAAGLEPSGNRDPFGQRRAALGLVQNLIAWNLLFDLRPALDAAAANLPIAASDESRAAMLRFIIERLRNTLLEQGGRYDVIEAVLAEQGANPARAANAVQALSGWVEHKDWGEILPAFARCVRITRDFEQSFQVDEELLIEPAEIALHQKVLEAERTTRAQGSVDDFLNAFTSLIPTINNFFDQVLVMTEDDRTRQNRLGLLQRITTLSSGVADMSRLEGF